MVEEKVTSGIYKITCLSNGKIYIGLTQTNLEGRIKEHKIKLKSNKHHNSSLQKDFNLYGIDNFEFDILEYVPFGNLVVLREKYYIAKYDAENELKGYNCNFSKKQSPISSEYHKRRRSTCYIRYMGA